MLAASYYQIEAITRARALGWRVLTTDNRPDNPGHVLADRSFDVDTTDREAVLALAIREGVDGIIAPGTDAALPTAAYVAERLGLPGPGIVAARVACDKVAFREFLRARKLPTPEFLALGVGEVPPGALFTGGQRWVIKPDRSSGSKGVAVVTNPKELARCQAAAQAFSPTGRTVLERYLDGVQGTCEGLLQDGRVLWHCLLDRQTVALPHTATCGHHLPTRLSPARQAELVTTLEEVWRALGVTNGPFDVDFIVADGILYLLELSPRMGGNSISRLVHRACDVDLVEHVLRWVCDASPRWTPPPFPRPTALILLGVEHDGCLDYDAAGFEWLRAEPWVVELRLEVARGTPVRAFIDGRHRVGEAIVCADSREQLEARVKEFRARLCLTTW